MVSGAAARRLRSGVAGAAGFLKTASSSSVGETGFDLLGLTFLVVVLSSARSAERFLAGSARSDVVAMLVFATRVERRKDMLSERKVSMQWSMSRRAKDTEYGICFFRELSNSIGLYATKRGSEVDAFSALNNHLNALASHVRITPANGLLLRDQDHVTQVDAAIHGIITSDALWRR